MTAVISACIRKTSELVIFLCSRLNIDSGRKKGHISGIFCFIISRKVNTQLKHRGFVQCVEKVLWPNMVYGVVEVICKVSCWRFLTGHCSMDRSVEVDSNQTETLIENNQHYIMLEIADILKISKSNIENHLHICGYVNHRFDVWVPHKLHTHKNPSWQYLCMWFSILT